MQLTGRIVGAGSLVSGALRFPLDQLRARQQAVPRRGEAGAAQRSQQQRLPQRALQRLDRGGQAGLGNRQLAGGCAKTALVDNGQKSAQLLQSHGNQMII
jgi:hypothetical protein